MCCIKNFLSTYVQTNNIQH